MVIIGILYWKKFMIYNNVIILFYLFLLLLIWVLINIKISFCMLIIIKKYFNNNSMVFECKFMSLCEKKIIVICIFNFYYIIKKCDISK